MDIDSVVMEMELARGPAGSSCPVVVEDGDGLLHEISEIMLEDGHLVIIPGRSITGPG